MFAPTTLRTANSRSGMSGCAERASTATNAPSSTAAATNPMTTCAEPQPWSPADDTANTRAATPAVTSTAPGTSSRVRPVAPRFGTPRSVVTSATSTIGMLTSSTARQPKPSASTPDSTTPTAPPPAPAPLHSPMALPREASGTSAATSASDEGAINAPAIPCSARAAMSEPLSHARPPHRLASRNRTSPVISTARRPITSPSRPPSSMNPAKVSR